MAITILPPVVEDSRTTQADSDVDSMSIDSDGGVELGAEALSRPSKRQRLTGSTEIDRGIVAPGEVVTDDPQWMRLVSFPKLAFLGMHTSGPS